MQKQEAEAALFQGLLAVAEGSIAPCRTLPVTGLVLRGLVGLTDRVLAEALQTMKGLRWVGFGFSCVCVWGGGGMCDSGSHHCKPISKCFWGVCVCVCVGGGGGGGQLLRGVVGLTDRVLAEALQTMKGLGWAFHHFVACNSVVVRSYLVLWVVMKGGSSFVSLGVHA